MIVRFHLDPETGLPHIYEHGVTEDEVHDILHSRRAEDVPASGDSRMRLGQTKTGRYLQVTYVPDEEGDGVFVITAYELKTKAKRAYRRRQRRKPKRRKPK
jgi:hypothetical protein